LPLGKILQNFLSFILGFAKNAFWQLWQFFCKLWQKFWQSLQNFN
jgi:hypothetical protein